MAKAILGKKVGLNPKFPIVCFFCSKKKNRQSQTAYSTEMQRDIICRINCCDPSHHEWYLKHPQVELPSWHYWISPCLA